MATLNVTAELQELRDIANDLVTKLISLEQGLEVRKSEYQTTIRRLRMQAQNMEDNIATQERALS